MSKIRLTPIRLRKPGEDEFNPGEKVSLHPRMAAWFGAPTGIVLGQEHVGALPGVVYLGSKEADRGIGGVTPDCIESRLGSVARGEFEALSALRARIARSA